MVPVAGQDYPCGCDPRGLESSRYTLPTDVPDRRIFPPARSGALSHSLVPEPAGRCVVGMRGDEHRERRTVVGPSRRVAI